MSNRMRNLLHKTRVREFVHWAVKQGYVEEPNVGEYECVRLRQREGGAPLIYYVRLSGDHLTSFGDGTKLVYRWIAERDKVKP